MSIFLFFLVWSCFLAYHPTLCIKSCCHSSFQKETTYYLAKYEQITLYHSVYLCFTPAGVQPSGVQIENLRSLVRLQTPFFFCSPQHCKNAESTTQLSSCILHGFLASCPAHLKMRHLPQGENQQRGMGWLVFLFSLCSRILVSQVLVVSAGLNSSFSLSSPGRCQSLWACLLLSRGLYLLYLTSQPLAFEAEELVYAAKEVAA